MQLRKIEESKIDCARKFFAKITNEQVRYEVVDGYGKLMNLERKMTMVYRPILPLITLIFTDFTERIGGNLTHFSSEHVILSDLFKISSISEISGFHLPF